jgi:hypothetical protein
MLYIHVQTAFSSLPHYQQAQWRVVSKLGNETMSLLPTGEVSNVRAITQKLLVLVATLYRRVLLIIQNV